MKHMPGFTDFFMSPVTGRILQSMLPDLTDDYTWVGDFNDRPVPSPTLIDLQLEIIQIRNRLALTDFIIGHESEGFTGSQVLDQLTTGILKQTAGVVSIAIPGTDYQPAGDYLIDELPENEIWIGNNENIPTPMARILDDGSGNGNLPAYTPLNWKQIWRMTITGKPALSSDLTTAEAEIDTLQEEVTTLQEDVATIEEEITTIEGEITDLTTRVTTLEGEMATAIDNIATLEGDVATLDTEVEALTTQVESNTADILTLIDEVTEAQSEITLLQEDVVSINAELETLTTEVATNTADITTLNTEVAELTTQVDANTADIITLDADVATLDTEVAANTADILTLDADVAALDITVAANTADILTLDETIEGITEDIAALDADVTALDADVTALDISVAANTADILVLDASVAANTADILTLDADVGVINTTSIRLSGNVTGSATIADMSLGGSITTTLNMTLDTIPAPVSNVSMNGYQINDLVMASIPANLDAVNVQYVTDALGVLTADISTINDDITALQAWKLVESGYMTTVQGQIITLFGLIGGTGSITLTGNVTGTGFVGTPFATTLNMTLDTIPAPVANLSLNSQRIISLATPINPTDGATKGYVDSAISGGVVTLVGNVTGSGDVGTNISTTLNMTLDTIPLAVSNLNLNTHQINNLAMAGTPASTDAVNVTYMNSQIASAISAGTVVLTGNVTGSGHVGTSFATTLNMTLDTIPHPVANLNLNSYQINNLAMASSPLSTDAVNVSYLTSKIAAGTIVLTGDVTGSGTVGTSFATTLTKTLDLVPLAVGSVNLNTHKLINVLDPTLAQDAATKHYVDTSTITLTGNVTGSGSVNGSFATTLNMTLDTIPHAVASLNLNTHQINNLAMAGTPASTDAVNVTYMNTAISTAVAAGTIVLTGNVTGSGHVGTSFATTLALTLDTIPLAAANLNLNTHQINNLAMAATPATTDAVNVSYLNTKIAAGTIVLTGSVSGSGTVGTSFATTLNTVLNSVPLATGNLNLNTHQLNNLAMAGTPASTDAVNVTYMNSAISSAISAGTVVLTGDVAGSGHVGTSFATTLADTINKPSGHYVQSLIYNSADYNCSFKIQQTNVPTGTCFLNFGLYNAYNYGYNFFLTTTPAGDSGSLVLQALNYSSTTSVFTITEAGALFKFGIPVQIQAALDMNTHQINNLSMAGTPAGTDAVNVTYMNTAISTAVAAGTIVLTGNVTGSGHVGTSFATTLNMTLDAINDPVANINMNTYQINNLAMAATPATTDAVNVSYMNTKIAAAVAAGTIVLTGSVSGSGTVGTSFATTLNTTLNNVPLATGNLNLNTKQINNLAMAGTPATTDAVNVTYMNTAISTAVSAGTVVLTGNVTGSGHVGTSFATTLNMTLDAINDPVANINMNTHQINNLAMAATPATTDAVNVSYLNNSVVSLTGDVSGFGHPTGVAFTTTLADSITKASSHSVQSLYFNSADSDGEFKILSSNIPATGGTCYVGSGLYNAYNYGYKFLLTTTPTNQQGNFALQSLTSSSATTLYTITPSLYQINIPVTISSATTIQANLSMYGNRVTSLNDPSSSSDAATKNYVDSVSKAYGKIYGGSTTTLSASVNTKLNGLSGSTSLHNFSVLSANTITYTGTVSTGICIQFAITFSLSSSASTCNFSVYQNSSQVSYFGQIPVSSGTQTYWTGSCVTIANSNDTFSIYCETNNVNSITTNLAEVAIFTI